MKAMYNGKVIAESDKTIVVEGNHYFPPTSLKEEYYSPNDIHTSCPWKGTANYFTINVDGKVNEGAAWYYPQAKERAKNIEGYIAFWRGVEVVE